MANPSLQIGNDNWAIKEDNLLGYSTAGTRFVPQPITMTRATAGTRVNPSGLVETVDLVVGSEFIDNTNFATDTDWGGSYTINTVTQQLTKTSSGLAYQIDGGIIAGKSYKIVVDVASLDGATTVWVAGNNYNLSLGIQTIYATGGTNSWNGGRIAINNGYASGAGSVLNSISVKEATIDNLPRVDYTDGTSSLLAEPQRTNNLTASQDLTVSFWNSINTETIVASTVLSPDGTNFGFKAIPSTSTSTHYVDYDYGFLSMPIGEVTYSIFVKPFGYTNFQLASSSGMLSRYQNFELTGDGVLGAGDVNGAKIEKIGDWYRCTITETSVSASPRVLNIATPSSGLGRNPSFTGNGTDGVLLWGAQIEEGTYPTSYIPNLSTTSGSTVTRNQETYEKTGISDLINSEEGVLFVEMAALDTTIDDGYLSLNNGGNYQIRIGYLSEKIYIQIRINGAVPYFYSFVGTISDFNKIAVKWTASEQKVYVNGSPVDTGTASTIFPTDTLNNIEFAVNLSTPLFAKVKQLQVFKTALTDSELATLTT